MNELNIGLIRLIEDYRNDTLKFEDIIVNFEFLFESLIRQYSMNSRNLIDIVKIREVKNSFYMILLKLSNLKNLDLRLNNYQVINDGLRLDIGLNKMM